MLLTRRRTAHAVLGVLLTAGLLAGCGGSSRPQAAARHTSPPAGASPSPSPSPSNPALAAFYDQKLDWSSCGSGFQCADLTVPLDYAHPDGQKIQIAVNRHKATGGRIGSLVVNPGGPGGSGLDYATAIIKQKLVPAAVLARFDLVGFDPRGVGKSAPVQCLGDKQLDAFVALDPTPENAAARQALVQGSQQFAAACEQHSAELLPHVGTVDAARDLDILRAALGDPKLTYLGKSYGTFLGAVYAGEFPTHVRALVLDGALDPRLTGPELDKAQAQGFETALQSFLADCVKRSDCPLGRDVTSAEQKISDLQARADTSPLPASRYVGADGRSADEAEVTLGIAFGLYSKDYWSSLRQALAAAMQGDGSLLLYFADLLVDRSTNGHYSNQTAANTAVNCVDRPEPRDPAAYTAESEDLAKVAPHFGAFIGYGALPCAFWPVAPTLTPGPITAQGAPPILVIGTTRDPATPYAWAQGLAAQLSSGVLLTHNGDGHTAYGDGDACIDNATNAYLISLTPPKAGTAC
jgi:pimeloyl-ACP methyl ester carboxylesterase